MSVEPAAREIVRFEGTIGRPGDPYYRRIVADVPRGSEAHAFALSRDWLHEVMAGPSQSSMFGGRS